MDSMTRQRESFAIDIVAVKTLKGENCVYVCLVVHF